MRSTLQLSDAQVQVVTPADPGPGRSLEPESHGIFRTMIRAHVVLGLMGAVAGALVFGVLWAIEIPFIVNSAVTAAAVLVGFEAVAGLMLDGLGYGIVGLAWTEWVALASCMLVGLVLVVAALRLLDRHGRLMFLPRPGAGLWPWLHPLQRRLLPANSTAGGGVAAADARNGALTMAAFGLGTLPLSRGAVDTGRPVARAGPALDRWRVVLDCVRPPV